MKTKTIIINGMKCMGCVANVEKALKAIDGIHNVNVDLKAKNATIEYDETKTGFTEMKEAITAIGFEAAE